MNGYFQLVIGKAGTAVKVFGATDGDPEITTGEITEYLDRNRIGYDVLAVNDAVKKWAVNLFILPRTGPIL